MNKKNRIIFFVCDILIALVLFATDRLTKILATQYLSGTDGKTLINGVFELVYLENRGAAFGMLQNQRVLFIIVGVLFLCVILTVLYLLPATKKYRAIRVCLCLLSAGALGNLYDRITLNYVIDFFYFSYINFPVFNLADIYVTVSTGILIILLLFFYSEDELDLKKLNTVKVHSSIVQDTEDTEDTEDTDDTEDTGGNVSEAEKSVSDDKADEQQ